jgi:hypothetical protein
MEPATPQRRERGRGVAAPGRGGRSAPRGPRCGDRGRSGNRGRRVRGSVAAWSRPGRWRFLPTAPQRGRRRRCGIRKDATRKCGTDPRSRAADRPEALQAAAPAFPCPARETRQTSRPAGPRPAPRTAPPRAPPLSGRAPAPSRRSGNIGARRSRCTSSRRRGRRPPHRARAAQLAQGICSSGKS